MNSLQNMMPVGGSPLIPPSYLTVYFVIFLVILTSFYIYFYRQKRPKNLLQKVKLLLIIAVTLKVTFISGIALLGAYWLIPTPSVRRTTEIDGKIEIVFDRPVKRSIMEKFVSPDAPGVWVFENSIYTTHLYRNLVFYPSYTMRPNSTYTVKLTNIRNLLNISKPYDYSFDFKTSASPNVLEVTLEKEVNVKLDSANANVSQFDFQFTPKVDFDISLNDSKSEYTITPKTAFSSETQYNLKILKSDIILNLEDKNVVERTTPVLVYDGSFPRKDTKPIAINTEVKWLPVSTTTKLDVPAYLQIYTLSCEVAALRMALNFKGANVTEDDLIPKIGTDPTAHTGNVWGDPNKAFVGNIRGTQMKDGYGVHWAPIAKAARNYREAQDFQGWSISQLTDAITKGNPVVIWVYSHFGTKTTWTTPDGTKIDAVRDEHAVVAVGFVGPANNPTQIIINDPLIGQVYWSRSNFDKKWEIFGRSGVVVY